MLDNRLDDVDAVAKLISVPVKDWPGNCHTISQKILAAGLVPGGKLRYGHWLGPVVESTMFHGKPINRHGWLDVVNDGTTIVVDPTRWVFEAAKPYIYRAPDFDGFYDIGGNAFKMSLMLQSEPPDNDGKPPQLTLPDDHVGNAIRHILGEYSGDTVSIRQAHYVATQPLQFLAGQAKEIYEWLDSHDERALVPMDNWQYVMDD